MFCSSVPWYVLSCLLVCVRCLVFGIQVILLFVLTGCARSGFETRKSGGGDARVPIAYVARTVLLLFVVNQYFKHDIRRLSDVRSRIFSFKKKSQACVLFRFGYVFIPPPRSSARPPFRTSTRPAAAGRSPFSSTSPRTILSSSSWAAASLPWG